MQTHRRAPHIYGDNRFPEEVQACGTWTAMKQQLTGEGCSEGPGTSPGHGAFLGCTLIAHFLAEGPT